MTSEFTAPQGQRELAPCPFCTDTECASIDHAWRSSNGAKYYYVSFCIGRTEDYDTPEEAAAAWNQCAPTQEAGEAVGTIQGDTIIQGQCYNILRVDALLPHGTVVYTEPTPPSAEDGCCLVCAEAVTTQPSTREDREWNLEAVYDAEILPLVAQIIAICHRVGMPMVATFQYANSDEEGGSLCTSALPIRPHDCIPTIIQASALIQNGGRPAPMMLTVRDGEGRVKSMEAIL